MIIPSRARTLTGAVFGASLAWGALAAVFYYRLGLTLSHYDARGHLVVARRIVDSITPGWQQIGAVWLPLPHLLNAIPVQIDAFYRTGASGVAISVAVVRRGRGGHRLDRRVADGFGGRRARRRARLRAQPNVLYLQATPMTEPLLLALTVLGVAMLLEWANGEAVNNAGRVDVS